MGNNLIYYVEHSTGKVYALTETFKEHVTPFFSMHVHRFENLLDETDAFTRNASTFHEDDDYEEINEMEVIAWVSL